MSRRESRVSMNVRQNDALFEFENFKKKFLLANKHITKLNSTLSVRIEELNAQISSLYVENLRLRASEIALAAQLKREREKSRKIMAEAEAATLNLTKHLGYIRQSFNVSAASPPPSDPPSPRARRPPPPNPNASPNAFQMPRLSRPPNVPGINEEEEPLTSLSDHELDQPTNPPAQRKSKTKSRLSASRLPLPARVTSSSPPLLLEPASTTVMSSVTTMATKHRKPTRRQSGRLSVNTDALSVPRASSPAFGSPIRLEAGLAEEEEEMAAVNGQLQVEENELEVTEKVPTPEKKRRKSKEKDRATEKEKNSELEAVRRERKRPRERDEEEGIPDGGQPRQKDVTNSRVALSPIDNTVYDQDAEAIASNTRQFLRASPTPSNPTSRSSSSPVPPSDGDLNVAGGRERRVRKSVNYAEPKLNTKMRKPDPPPDAAPPKKRSSAAAVLMTHKSKLDSGNDADNDTEARFATEPPLRLNSTGYLPPELVPLPPSRPSSSASASQFPATPMAKSSAGSMTAMKRKKSRPQLVLDEDESDGAQADAEYAGRSLGVRSAGANGWVNVDGRRKAFSSAKRSIAALQDEETAETRRHSMAV